MSGFTFGGPPTAPSLGPSSQPTLGSAAPSSFSNLGSMFNTNPGAPQGSSTPGTGFSFETSKKPMFGGLNFPQTTNNNLSQPGFGGTMLPQNNMGGGNGINFGVASISPIGTNGAFESIKTQIDSIEQAYKNSVHSRFKHVVYNLVEDPSLRERYGKPAEVNEIQWRQAKEQNPDPSCLVPAAIIGFAQLNKRLEIQKQTVDSLISHVETIFQLVENVENNCSQIDRKVEECRRRQMSLVSKLVEVMKKVDVLQARGLPLQISETRFSNDLAERQYLLNKPTEFKAKLSELVSLQRMHESVPKGSEVELDPESTEAMLDIIDQQRKGLDALTMHVRTAQRDVKIMMEGKKI